MNFTMIIAQPSDFNQFRNIHRLCMHKSVSACLGTWDDTFQGARVERHWANTGPNLRFIYIDKTLIGTLNFHKNTENELLLEQLYILPEYQKREYGTKLLNTVLNMYPECTAKLSVLSTSEIPYKLYVKMGFTEYKRDDYMIYMHKLPTLEYVSGPNI